MNVLLKNWLKKTAMGLSVFLLLGCTIEAKQLKSAAGQASLERTQAAQAKRDDIDNRPLVTIITSEKSDRFTQTEAHLYLAKIRRLIAKNYRVEEYLNVISTVVAKEAKYKNTHYAFYNTTSNMWRLAQDLYTRLYAYQHPGAKAEDFKFLRFDNESINATAKGFLVNELKEKGLVDDNTSTAAIMLSVNLSLFGNVGFPGECSWQYFVKPAGHREPRRETYEKMMDQFGFSHKYIDEIMSLVKIYDTDEDTIVQIFVPINKVDEIGYVAWVKGIPAHGDTIDWILKHAKTKSFEKGVKPTMEKLTDQFARQQASNPLFKNMMEGIQAGDFSLDKFLKVYRNSPWKIKEINDVTARLLFTPNVLLNPSSGVKFYRYSTVAKEKLEEYNKKLNEIISKLIEEKESGVSLSEPNVKPSPVVAQPSPVITPQMPTPVTKSQQKVLPGATSKQAPIVRPARQIQRPRPVTPVRK